MSDTTTETQPTPELAQSLHLDKQTGIVTINGEPLGYYIADEPVQVTVDPSGLTTVRLPIVCASFTATPMHPQG